MNATQITVPAGAFLLFYTGAKDPMVHANGCAMGNTEKRGKVVKISEHVQGEVDDLLDRGFKVKLCKCCR